MPRLNAPKKNLGFTLIEILVIILIVGILSAITIPSFISLVDKINLNNAVIEVRAALQTGQREAIRKSQVCSVGLNTVERTVTSYCLGEVSNLSTQADIATNISKNSGSPGNTININFGILGTAEFIVDPEDDLEASQGTVQPNYTEMSWYQVSISPQDNTGKIVFYLNKNPALTKKCIAISNILGLTRVGNYTGKINNNSKLSKKGICTAY
ncbi:prepilin-type N-terminal cleavage/methylation domain-containing protein [Synechocystis sp. PCC 7509]|uniref:prepilin-type N-terminal cleavage/methylation domain-containing protein n=1 Tax=Synechocystis sp. PCC 7509 TaxID=927677 RepID=UPI0002ABD64A|nr:prepilin-type N-terminal cleavage/methylation domain-containing protein [Synechocystis sp. PCC 7509]